MKITRYAALVLLFSLTGFTVKNQNYPKVKTFKEIDAKNINEDTLVLLDIDNTIYRAKSHYGSIEFFLSIYQEVLQTNNLTSAQAKLASLDRWINSQRKIETKLIDEKIDEFIRNVKSKNSHIYAFTARPASMKELTYTQLSNHKIKFEFPGDFAFAKSYSKQIFPDAKWCEKNLCNKDVKADFYNAEAEFYKGVIFSNDINSKGEVLIDFLKNYMDFREKQKLPLIKKVIFVDDKIHNLESVESAIKSLNLKFVGYHIVDDFKYDHAIALSEEEKHRF